jgi:hypothetical protein
MKRCPLILMMALSFTLLTSGCAMLAKTAMNDQNARDLEKGRISGAEYLKQRQAIDEHFRGR